MTYRELLKQGTSLLEASRIDEAYDKAITLLLNVKNWSKTDYILKSGETVTKDEKAAYEAFLALLTAHVPLQHILQSAPFYGRDFYVDEHVLVPRFDTEVLVSEVLKDALKGAEAGNYGKAEMRPLRILDLCTGSGCIAVTLFLELREKGIPCEMTASDISPEALSVAVRNAGKLGADVTFMESDLFSGFGGLGAFDYIVSNPPYIRPDVIETLSEEVRDHDPRLALDGGPDGLLFYRKIIKNAGNYLEVPGRLFFEIGEEQGNDVSKLLKNSGFTDIRIVKDLAGLDRVVEAAWRGI